MTRIIIYTAIYLTTLLYALFQGVSSNETLVFLVFLISSLGYTFSREGLPNEETQHYPEAFAYKTQRINIYGIGMVIALGCISVLYGFNTTMSLVSQTALILICWPILILTSFILAKIHQHREQLYSICDYVSLNLKQQVDLELIQTVLGSLENTGFGATLSRSNGKVAKYNTQILRETEELILNYLRNSTSTISYDEIESAENSKL